jgi:hypothetical protein
MSVACPNCHRSVEENRFCILCGAALPPWTPRLELFDFRPWFPAGSYTAFGLRLSPLGRPLLGAEVRLWGSLLGEATRDLRLLPSAQGLFQDHFDCMAPPEGGSMTLRLEVACELEGGGSRRFRGSTLVPLIGNQWDRELIRRNVNGLVLELRNKGGLVRHEGKITPLVDRLVVDNEEGITRLMGDLEAGATLCWPLDLCPLEAAHAAPLSRASLRLLKGNGPQYLRILALPEVSLGRFQAGADLWFCLFPMYKTRNHHRMNRISARHLLISRGEDGWSVADRSSNGTWLNGTRLDGTWRPIAPGDRIGILEEPALTLHADPCGESALRLTRRDEGELLEAFLLLVPENEAPAPIGDGAAIFHQGGGLHLRALADGVRVNNRPLGVGASLGLNPDDRIQERERVWELVGEIYPGQ